MTDYISTRGLAEKTTFRGALLSGLASDGGLFVPAVWPSGIIGPSGLATPADLGASDDFSELAAYVLAPFTEGWIGPSVLREEARAAYASFADPRVVAPLRPLGEDLYLLELFHGPTLAFKDVAMQLLGRFFARALGETGARLTILGATSGDTGGAAVAAFAGAPGVDLIILYPDGRISDVQRQFMTTSGAANVRVIAVDGGFDACQSIVKALFADPAFVEEHRLSGVNSINWARLAIQAAYYVSAARALAALGERRPPTFVVPTGNFGDAFAGFIARRLGLPMAAIEVAVNENDVLHRAFETGLYRPQGLVATDAPSMDIEVASNFERLLFETTGRDAELVRALMRQLRETGAYEVPASALAAIRAEFSSARVDAAGRAATMRRWAQQGTILDPHTAIAMAAAETALRHGRSGPKIVLATAHPAKFPDAVAAATGHRPPRPAALAHDGALTERFIRAPASPDAIKRLISA